MAATPVILNATAGPGYSSESLARLTEAFSAAGAEARLLQARSGDDIAKLARTELRANPPVIVAAGGDGTLNTVAAVLAGTPTALGILPLGTYNHFAKDLAIPLELEEAVRVIVANHQATVDVGEVNGRIFLNNSSIGLYPAMVRERDSLRKRLGHSKPRAMFWAMLTVLQRYPFLDVHLEVEGAEAERHTPFIFIGNNAYAMEGFEVGTRECLDAGCLSVYLAQRRGRWALLALVARALFGRLRAAGDFEALTTSAVRIATRQPRLPVATDGEVTVMDMPLEYRARPGALRVVVPAPASVQ